MQQQAKTALITDTTFSIFWKSHKTPFKKNIRTSVADNSPDPIEKSHFVSS
jgi:hypothetical protein